MPPLLHYARTEATAAVFCRCLNHDCAFRKIPNEPVSLSKLRELGVVSWKIDVDNYKTDPKLAAIKQHRGYTYQVRRTGCHATHSACKGNVPFQEGNSPHMMVVVGEHA
jgi:hypothetical protein